ncbi:acylneuraminate cytidylyltransferase family protein [Tenacibaculum jejuense]|uniref:Cytidylyltransferase n=1 Tax=Tenacibaculum jejuense TaxID=584609 RepID=A0A238U7A8_9FLAO|nr:acylneuraminate cytidylyltransferase family protein [Tenacibaculum jejuense]SNR14896.1 Cytidylyltransferase [Tenacibaculum jejuense]
MDVLITVCARGGSKGVPGKNIKELAGKPLINYTIDVAKKLIKRRSEDIIDIVLSTDSEEIRKVVRNTEGEGVFLDYKRPQELATDESGKLDVIIDVKKYMEENRNKKYDYILDLDVSSPLRTIEDVEYAFQELISDKEAYNIFSVNTAHKNPYFNMVEKYGKYYNLCKKGNFLTRQSATEVYEMNASFYIYRDSFFNEGNNSAITEKSLIYKMDHMCFDIDSPIDFEFMEYLITNNKLSINI